MKKPCVRILLKKNRRQATTFLYQLIMKKRILFSFLLFFPLFVWSQKPELSGYVKDDETGRPVAYATLVLCQSNDSSFVAGTISTEEGRFRFENLTPGAYILLTSYVGYEKLSCPLILPPKKGQEVELLLTRSATELDEVVVQAERLPVQFQKDKLIIQMSSYTSTGGKMVSDVLKTLPGVIAQGTDLTVLGKMAIVYIDGRPSRLAGSELSRYLENLPASQIDKVEIIANPSSKYDAGHDGAVLNIRFKRDATLGVNGYASLMLGARTSGVTTMPGISLNYRTKKLNMYGSYNLSNGRYKHTYDETSRYTDLAAPVQYDEYTTYKPKGTNQSAQWGMDYFLSDAHTLGGLLMGGLYNGGNVNHTVTSIHAIGAFPIDSTVVSPIDMHIDTKYLSANLNHSWKIKGEGSRLNTDMNYFLMNHDQRQTILSDYYQNETVYRPTTGKRHATTYQTDIFSIKTDYTVPFAGGGEMEAGIKYDRVNRDNDMLSDVFSEEEWQTDREATNHMKYKEQILGVYLQASKKIRSFSLHAGLRYEITFQDGRQTTTGEHFSGNYSGLFPSVGLAYRIREQRNLSLSYTKKISRPSLSALNPFKFYTSPYVYQVGNPDLDPSVFHAVDLAYQLHAFSFSFSYNRRNHVIIQEPFQNDETKEISYTYKNFGRTDVYGFYGYLPFTPVKWWKPSFNVNASYQALKSAYMGTLYRHHFFSGYLRMSHQFIVNKGFKINWNAGYYSARWNIATKIKNWGSMDLSFVKSCLRGRGNLSLVITDPFRWDTRRTTLLYQNIDRTTHAIPDLREVRISFQYTFGSDQIKQSRNRSTGVEELQNRL